MCMVCLFSNGKERPCRDMYSPKDVTEWDRMTKKQIAKAQTKDAIRDLLKTDPEFRKDLKEALKGNRKHKSKKKRK